MRTVSVQQFPLIERDGALQRLAGTQAQAGLEIGDIRAEPVPVERDGVGIRLDEGISRPQVLAEDGQGLAETATRLEVVVGSPEEAGDGAAGVLPARAKRQVGQQHRRLSSRQGDSGARGRAELEPAQQLEPQDRHGSPRRDSY